MAAQEYYSQGGRPQPPYGADSNSSPYYQSHDTPSPGSTPAPPYQAAYSAPPDTSIYPAESAGHVPTSKPAPYSPSDISYTPAAAYAAPGQSSSSRPQGQGQTEQSPFDTVFDDNAYPMNTNSRPTPSSSTGDIGQHGFYQDTSYHGGPDQAHGHGQGQEAIPLQDRPGKDVDAEMNDHIYDAPGRNRKGKKGKVRLGELGMLGANNKRIPWVVYIFSVVQIAVFIACIARNGVLTGSPIATKPDFNIFIGPSYPVLINMGARFAPCMHNVKGIQDREMLKTSSGLQDPVVFMCPNATKNDTLCSLKTVCGFGGTVPNPKFNGDIDQSPQPNQWFRFITSIFLHAGVVHILFNLLVQLTIGKDMERAIGPVRFLLVYISAGIFGNIMGGNYAPPGYASMGASGAIFGIIALTLLDLLYSWKDRKSPVKDLLFIFLDMAIAFVLGLLPGLDNFAHIGGFLMGLSLGVCVLHSPNSLRRRIGQELSYSAVSPSTGETPPPFFKNPVGFFKGRKPLWWAWWLIRAGFLVMIIVVFIVLLNRFYTSHEVCKWCKHINCLPVKDWCDLGNYDDPK
ncbi:hypothetical protein MRS44_012619 [Fusarium solani]|uniref:uncharacterized protein n=1 Tax=Fusarium solani TaxID=169388 RepID=UPI0032C46D04|nr:hypothetical protein MRS44_012619 [Fusarium solani]